VNVPTANAFILPGATNLGANAFGDEPVIIFKGERVRWINADTQTHNIVTDTAAFPEFTTTGQLTPGGEKAFIMNTVGTTPIHCADHPAMTGTLVVRER
jgi:plastocyanin